MARAFPRLGEILDLGVKAGVVEKSGAWFSYDSQRIGQGRENVQASSSRTIRTMAGRDREADPRVVPDMIAGPSCWSAVREATTARSKTSPASAASAGWSGSIRRAGDADLSLWPPAVVPPRAGERRDRASLLPGERRPRHCRAFGREPRPDGACDRARAAGAMPSPRAPHADGAATPTGRDAASWGRRSAERLRRVARSIASGRVAPSTRSASRAA